MYVTKIYLLQFQLTYHSQCFYDNIVFAPFIFIEDPLDRGLASESSSRFIPGIPGMTVSNGSAPATSNGSSLTLIGKSNKVDPYYLITNVNIPFVNPPSHDVS